MLKFVLFAMIGYKLNMGKYYWCILSTYAFLWTLGKIMGWL